jgi:hypothetical protein
VTPGEAAHFLASVATNAAEPALFNVDDQRQMRSDRMPPRANGTLRVFNFFEEMGRLRLETIVHMAAMARLRLEFGWPREHVVFESPTVTGDEADVLTEGALDILLLDALCTDLAAKMA